MKLLKYVMTSDTGLAPNPYFDICSLALCTPNHMKARLQPGDWVLGHSCKATGNRLIYAMRLTKVIDMNQYFREYPQKRPVLDGKPEQTCGDNLYFRNGAHWRRVERFHYRGQGQPILELRHRRATEPLLDKIFDLFGLPLRNINAVLCNQADHAIERNTRGLWQIFVVQQLRGTLDLRFLHCHGL